MTKGKAMSLSQTQTIDDLLADTLIQAIMRADHVEPQALKSILNGAASRIGSGRNSPWRHAGTISLKSALDQSATFWGTDAPLSPILTARVLRERCGAQPCW
jgi:hypothetical protein